MKDFNTQLREYERMCDRLPGGPNDPYDEDATDEDRAEGESARLERAIEKADNRRKERMESWATR